MECQSRCRWSVDWVSIRGWSRVSNDTWPWMPLVHVIQAFQGLCQPWECCAQIRKVEPHHNNQHTGWFLHRHPMEPCTNKYPCPWWSVTLFHPSVEKWLSRHVQQPLKTKNIKHYWSKICFIIMRQGSLEVNLSIIIIFRLVLSWLGFCHMDIFWSQAIFFFVFESQQAWPECHWHNKLLTNLAGSGRTEEYWPLSSFCMYLTGLSPYRPAPWPQAN